MTTMPVVGATPNTRRHRPVAVARRDLCADAVMAACDEYGGAVPSEYAVRVIREVLGVTGPAMARSDLENLVRDGRLSRARVRGVWWTWPTLATLVVGERLLAGRIEAAA